MEDRKFRMMGIFLGTAIFGLVVLLVVALLSGCMVAEGEKTTYDPFGNVTSHVKVKMTQCMIDSKRSNFEVKIPDLGKVSLGSSVMDAEEFQAILTELKPFLAILLGL